MKNIVILLFSIVVISIISFSSCQKEETQYNRQTGELILPSTPYKYFGSSTSPITNLDLQAQVGRVLFYDRNLSKNNGISCASCHIQSHAFGDNKAFSHGFENKLTERNSIAIHNLSNGFGFGISQNLFWDGRTTDIAEMVLQPSLNHIEMGMDSRAEIAAKIKKLTYYEELFKDAGYAEINERNISDALVQFVISINVQDSKFDKVHKIGGAAEATFTALERHGESVFNGKYNCNSCHNNPVSSYGNNAGSFVNIGLDKFSEDKGLMGVTGQESDRGKFKVPGLRNVQFSAPYMHDGRFGTLSEVLDHYSHGIENTDNLDPRLRENSSNGHAKKMNISDYDKKALIAFLNTLSDYDVLTHDRFSNPFKNQ